MKAKTILKKTAAMLFALLLAVGALLPQQAFAAGTGGEIDLSARGLRIGVGNGTVQEQFVRQTYPEAQVFYFEKVDGCTAVAQGKIDCYLYDKRQLEITVANGQSGVRVLEQPVGDPVEIALGISDCSGIPDLAQRVNDFIAALQADGTLDDMYQRWVMDHDTVMPEIPQPQAPDCELKVGTSGIVEPYSYYKGSELTGFDIELIYRLAARLNAAVSFEIFDYNAIVAAAHTGKVDLIAANLQVTPERAEALRFSDPLFWEETGVVVRQSGAAAGTGSGAVRWQDFNGKKLGILVGPLTEGLAAERFPDSEVLILDSYTDCITALLAGKIDAFLADEPEMKSLHAERPEIDYIHDRITNNDYCFAFRRDDPKSAALCRELNAFLARSWTDGTMQELDEIWFGVDEERKVVDMSGLTGENGTIRVVTTSSDMPFSYIKDGQNVGYDIDLVLRFCRDRGYALELGDVDFAGRIPAIQSGKYDFTTDMNATPERAEEVLFSDPTSHGGFVLATLASKLAPRASAQGGYSSLDQLAGKRIGVLTGGVHDALVQQRLPSAQIVYFSKVSDLPSALQAQKIDAFVRPYSSALFMQREDESLRWLDEHLLDAPLAFAFAKTDEGRALNQLMSEFIRALRQDGTLDAMRDKWFGADEDAKTMPDYDALPDPNGTLTMATSGEQLPFSYVRGTAMAGFEIDLAARFCEANGYRLQVEQMNFDGILAAVQTGKCDFAGSCLAVTEERKESVDFSESYYTESVVVVVPGRAAEESRPGPLEKIASSFEKTFIRESRWKLFLQGVGTTMLITVLSVLFGTALGFGVFMLCRNGNPAANAITRFSIWLVQGMPMVVLLMILYYIVFGRLSISGVMVAVIGFTLTFGSSVFGLMKMGVGTIDRGQYEAAYALGHSNRQTFYRIILPQAIPHILPAYQGEIVGLIKATAIVGYIAVQDLTKMGDIVRSRTYEAFFPLIAVTIIYFVLEGLLNTLVGWMRVHGDPKRRTKERILKGVKTDDQA